MTTLTYEDAKERLGKLAAERPDYVYEKVTVEDGDGSYTTCVYFDAKGAPSCIAGHAYADELRKIIAEGGLIEGMSAQAALEAAGAGYNLEPEAAQLLNDTQHLQDKGVPWGVAFRRALRAVESGGSIFAHA